jgi:peptidoglycan/xylan/chitin deacetylase (PgdA/CDA1 family)
MFHRVNEHGGDALTVRTDRFRRQMEWIAAHRRTTLSAAEFLDHKLGRREAPAGSVLLTFDDAWLDLYLNAWPILRGLGLRFTVFVVTRFSERASKMPQGSASGPRPHAADADAMTRSGDIGRVICGWDALGAMRASGLCSIECHTASHDPALVSSPGALRDDLDEARLTLCTRLGVNTEQLAWPHGRHDEAARRVARDAGFRAVHTAHRGINLPDGHVSKIRRFAVQDRDERWFAHQVTLFASPLRGWLYPALNIDRVLQRWRGQHSGDRLILPSRPAGGGRDRGPA